MYTYIFIYILLSPVAGLHNPLSDWLCPGELEKCSAPG